MNNPEQPPNEDLTTDYINKIAQTMGGHGAAEAAGSIAASGTVEPPYAEPIGTKPTHERPTPARWDEIADFASSLPVFGGTFDGPFLTKPIQLYNTSSVEALRERLTTLTDDELEGLRYYGIGMMICDLAQVLQDPTAREQMIESGAESLYTMLPPDKRHSLKPEDISTGLGGVAGFDQPIISAFHDLPPHLQLLNDALFWNQNERKTALQQGGSPDDYIRENSGILSQGMYAAGQCLPEIVAVALSGATLVLQRSLELRRAYLAEQDPTFPADASVQQVIDRTDMDEFNIFAVAKRAAGLRLDEFNLNLERYIALDGDGNVTFHGELLPRLKDLRQATMPATGSTLGTPLHTTRLRCPAMFVDGLIPDIVRSLVGVVAKTDQLIHESDKPPGHP